MLAFLRRSMVPCWPSCSWVDVAGSGTPVHASQHSTVSIDFTWVTCRLLEPDAELELPHKN